jgi:ketosteroid isomerase-like protein
MSIQPAVGSLQELLDERDILRTLHRYAHTLDAGDYAGFADCFTEDAVYGSTRNGPMATGRAELEDFAKRYQHAPAAFHKHVVVDPLINVDGDGASVRSYYFFIQDRPSGPFIASYGTYADRLVRGADGCWRLASRTIESEAMNPDGVSAVRPR